MQTDANQVEPTAQPGLAQKPEPAAQLSATNGKLEKPSQKPPGTRAAAESRGPSIDERKRVVHAKEAASEPKHTRRERSAKLVHSADGVPRDGSARRGAAPEKPVRQSQV